MKPKYPDKILLYIHGKTTRRDIAKDIKIHPDTINRHLKILDNLGFIKTKKDNNIYIYNITQKGLLYRQKMSAIQNITPNIIINEITKKSKSQQYYIKNKERILKRVNNYNKKNKDQIKKYKYKYNKNIREITKEERELGYQYKNEESKQYYNSQRELKNIFKQKYSIYAEVNENE